jgi:hypothetical protein
VEDGSFSAVQPAFFFFFFADWLNRRVKILKQLVDVSATAAASGEL